MVKELETRKAALFSQKKKCYRRRKLFPGKLKRTFKCVQVFLLDCRITKQGFCLNFLVYLLSFLGGHYYNILLLLKRG